MKKTIKLDEDKCTGCASCAVLYADIFTFDESRMKPVINERALEGLDEEKLNSIVQVCPSGALSVVDK